MQHILAESQKSEKRIDRSRFLQRISEGLLATMTSGSDFRFRLRASRGATSRCSAVLSLAGRRPLARPARPPALRSPYSAPREARRAPGGGRRALARDEVAVGLADAGMAWRPAAADGRVTRAMTSA